MDELRQVIEQELRDCVDGPPRPGSSGNAERVANAVRAYLASDGVIEAAARAIYRQSDLDPDTLYEHHEWEKWPVDERREYVDVLSGEPRVSLMHRGWRKRTAHARAALTAATKGDGET